MFGTEIVLCEDGSCWARWEWANRLGIFALSGHFPKLLARRWYVTRFSRLPKIKLIIQMMVAHFFLCQVEDFPYVCAFSAPLFHTQFPLGRVSR